MTCFNQLLLYVVAVKMLWKVVPCSVIILFAACAWANPNNGITALKDPFSFKLLLAPEHTPLATELSSRVLEHASRLQDSVRDPRLPIPTAQDLEAIRRVAQVLIMLGEQVIPAIIGEPVGMSSTSTEIPNDPVNNKNRS